MERVTIEQLNRMEEMITVIYSSFVKEEETKEKKKADKSEEKK